MYRFISIFVLFIVACNPSRPVSNSGELADKNLSPISAISSDTIVKIVKSEEEWKAELNDQEYYVLRERGTERSFSGDLWDHKEKGLYTCRACQLPLFLSDKKFKSGTGWPSFTSPINKKNILETEDKRLGIIRTEVLCARCEGHIGHIFEDGPPPTGLRYCINSVSLDFVKE